VLLICGRFGKFQYNSKEDGYDGQTDDELSSAVAPMTLEGSAQ
jgi:hypothetical protein